MSWWDVPIMKEGGWFLRWNPTLNNFIAGQSVAKVGGEDDLRNDIISYLKSNKDVQAQQSKQAGDNCAHLDWIYNRMIHVSGENPNVDYMVRFKEIIEQLEEKEQS